MEATLSGIPVETMDLVASHLDLPDLRCLRLVSGDTAAKVTSSTRFQSFCTSKAAELRVSSLVELKNLLCVPGPQTHLQDLTITGVLVTTKGLERIIRERTKPAHLDDPCCMRRGQLGNGNTVPRLPATDAEVEDASAQLSDFQQQIQTASEDVATGRDLHALAELFEVIKTHCKAGGLKSLTLDLKVRRERTTLLPPALGAPWRHVWDSARHTLSTFVQAWSQSAIGIERLDVFGKTDGCGIENCTLAALRNELDSGALRGLRSLSISISNRTLPVTRFQWHQHADKDEVRPETQRERAKREKREREANYANVPQMLGMMQQSVARLQPDADSAQQTAQELFDERVRLLKDPSNVTGLADWLGRCPDLEELSVRSYWIVNRFEMDGHEDRSRRKTWAHLAETVKLAKLRSLTILSAEFDAGILLKLLQNSNQLMALDMREINARPSDGVNWMRIFAHLTSPKAQLSSLYLDNIFGYEGDFNSYIACFSPGLGPGGRVATGETSEERKKRLGLVDYWDFRRPSAKGLNAFELTRREDVLRGIAYVANGSYVMGSVQNSMWMTQRKRQYGPLD